VGASLLAKRTEQATNIQHSLIETIDALNSSGVSMTSKIPEPDLNYLQ
jgi:hypothetical protein